MGGCGEVDADGSLGGGHDFPEDQCILKEDYSVSVRLFKKRRRAYMI